MSFHDREIVGSGGGAGKSGTATEDKNTLRSKATARVLDLISEGEIEGLVDGDKSIYFDGTPLKAKDGSTNIREVSFSERVGLPDQDYIKGNKQVETPYSVEIKITKSGGPVTRTITDANADSVRVVLRIPALAETDKEGNVIGADLDYIIERRSYGGTWTQVVDMQIRGEKCTSPYQIDHEIDLPMNGYPWDIRVERKTGDSDSTRKQNELWWEAYFTAIEGKFTYPNSALIYTEMKAERVGQSIPNRSYHVRGLKIEVPVNYDPVARTYTGIWNGTFKRVWSNNPAWIFRDIVVNDRYGLGQFVDAAKIDKWGLYTIAQYCDQLVPTGFKDINGNPTTEPRFVFNGVLNTREEAFRVLQNLSAAFRGMSYWSLGQVFAVSDMPSDPVKLVSPANVVGGEFSYSGTAIKARHSVALVQWNDPGDGYQPAIEVVINDKLLAKYGWREKSIVAYGCTSRGQAHRFGKWMLDVEQNETETVEYTASYDHIDLKPGDIIAIADPRKAAARIGGRIQAVTSTTVVTLDSLFTPTGGQTYSLMIELKDGSVQTRAISSWATVSGVSRVTVSPAFSELPRANAMWVITGSDIVPRQYRVLSVSESEKHLFRVNALFHDPTKYARVEQGINLDPLPYTRPTAGIAQPINLIATEQQYIKNGQAMSRITFSWSAGDPTLTSSYDVRVRTPDRGVITSLRQTAPVFDVDDVIPGPYVLEVAAVSYAGLTSAAAELSYAAGGWVALPNPQVESLVLASDPGQTVFSGTDIAVAWRNNLPVSNNPGVGPSTPGVNPFYKHNVVEVFDVATGQPLRVETLTGEGYLYDIQKNTVDNAAAGRAPSRSVRFAVSVEDTLGRVGGPAELIVSNPKPAAPTVSVAAGVSQLVISWTSSTDLDRRGSKVWVSTSSGFNPEVTVPVYDGPGTQFVFNGTAGQLYYVRVAHYDAFDKTNLNASAQMSGTPTAALGVDTTPPAVPTGLALSSVSALLPDGTFSAYLRAAWTANVEADLAGYQVEVTRSGQPAVTSEVSTNAFEMPAIPNAGYSVKLRAVDTSGNKSAQTAAVAHTVVVDSTPPATPTGLTLTAGFDAFFLNWAKNTEVDLAYYDVYVATTATPVPVAGTAPAYSTRAETLSRSGYGTGTTRYFWIRAVDRTGNRSAWAGPVSGTTRQAVEADIANAAIAAGKIANGAVSSQKLGAGTGANRVYNSDFRTSLQDWSIAFDDTGLVETAGRNLSNLYTLIGAGTAYVTVAGTPAVSKVVNFQSGRTIPVVAGQRYEFSAYLNPHRCSGLVYVTWLDVNGAGIVSSGGSSVANLLGETRYLSQYGRSTGFATAPAGAVSAIIGMQMVSIGGQANPYLFGTFFVFADAFPNQTEFSAWSPGFDNPALSELPGQIIATQITDGAISTPKLAANAITADKIAANAVIAGKIAADAITATNIQAGAVLADKIAAGAIAARHLTITDLTNMVLNGDFTQGSDQWVFGGTTIIESDAAASVAGAKRIRSTNRYAAYSGYIIECKAGETYYANAVCYNMASARARLLVEFVNDAGTWISTAIAAFTDTKNAWVDLGGQATAPVGAHRMRVYLERDMNDGVEPTNYTYWGKVQLRRAAGGELIVDGAVTATKIATGAIEAKVATIGTAFITNAHVVDLNGQKIQAETISGDKVIAQSIAASRLVLGQAADNLLVNGEFEENLVGWTGGYAVSPNGAFTTEGGGVSGSKRATLDRLVNYPDANYGVYLDSLPFPVDAGGKYELSGYFFGSSASATGLYFRINWYDQNNTYLSTNDAYSNAGFGTVWERKAAILTAPSTARYARVRVHHWTTSSSRYMMIDRIQVRKAIGTTVIEDGAITTDKITVGAIIADKIQANAIITDKIQIGAVVTDKIGVNAVTDIRTAYTNGSVGNPNATPINEVLLNSITINRTLGTKMVIFGSWRAEPSNDAVDSSGDVRITREGNNIFQRAVRNPYTGEAGGANTYGGEMFVNYVDEDTGISGNTNYRIYYQFPEVTRRFMMVQEFKR